MYSHYPNPNPSCLSCILSDEVLILVRMGSGWGQFSPYNIIHFRGISSQIFSSGKESGPRLRPVKVQCVLPRLEFPLLNRCKKASYFRHTYQSVSSSEDCLIVDCISTQVVDIIALCTWQQLFCRCPSPEPRTLDMPSATEDEQRCLKKYQVSSYFENGIWSS